MKRILLSAATFAALAGAVIAVPYASQIRVGTTDYNFGAGQSIRYFLNEAGGTTTIDIVDSSTLVVAATFNGTNTSGVNTVVWNGTVNNGGGADVPVGNYRVRVRVTATNSAGWVQTACHKSLGTPVVTPCTPFNTLFSGFSGKDLFISKDPRSEAFGWLYATSSFSAPNHAAMVVLNPDLSTVTGDGTTYAFTTGVARNTNQDTWGVAADPLNFNRFWVAGQNTDATNRRAIMYGDFPTGSALSGSIGPQTSGALTNAQNSVVALDNARGVAINVEGGSYYAYVALGNNNVTKALIVNGLVQSSPAPVNLLAGTIDGATNRYSKNVLFDSAGNLYWVSRHTASEANPRLYRWPAALFNNGTMTAGILTDANADWKITFPATATSGGGATITPDGNVYFICTRDTTTGADRGVYLVGNSSAVLGTVALTSAARVIGLGTSPTTFSNLGCSIASDYAGNIYLTDTSTEHLRAFSPGGNSDISIFAPPSQTFSASPAPTSSKNWELYQ